MCILVCNWLNVHVTDGLVCYLFGVKIIDRKFILQISQHISFLNDCYREAQSAVRSPEHHQRKGKRHIFTQYITGQELLRREFVKIGVITL